MVWTYHASYFSFASRSTTGTTHRLGDVRVPTLVVVGDNDVVGSNHVAQAQVLAKRIPNDVPAPHGPPNWKRKTLVSEG